MTTEGHTWVLGVVLSQAEDLQGADDIHGVHALEHSDQNLEGLNDALRFFDDCTHLAGVVW